MAVFVQKPAFGPFLGARNTRIAFSQVLFSGFYGDVGDHQNQIRITPLARRLSKASQDGAFRRTVRMSMQRAEAEGENASHDDKFEFTVVLDRADGVGCPTEGARLASKTREWLARVRTGGQIHVLNVGLGAAVLATMSATALAVLAHRSAMCLRPACLRLRASCWPGRQGCVSDLRAAVENPCRACHAALAAATLPAPSIRPVVEREAGLLVGGWQAPVPAPPPSMRFRRSCTRPSHGSSAGGSSRPPVYKKSSRGGGGRRQARARVRSGARRADAAASPRASLAPMRQGSDCAQGSLPAG